MSKKILIIEDNEDIRENIVEILELANYDVSSAENGKIGVKIAKEVLPDLIICDIMMPELDGFGVLHILSRDEETSHIPFVFLTAKVEKEDFRKGMNLGADDYITKPFHENELLDAIESRLRKKESVDKLISKKSEVSHIQNNMTLEALVKKSKLKKVGKKEIIYREGDYPNYIYYIQTGKVKSFLVNNDGKEFVVGVHGEGEFFGFAAIPENRNHQEMAATLEDSEIYFIQRFDFLELLHSNHEVSSQILGMMSGELLKKEQQLMNLAYDTVRKRVADALLDLNKKYESESDKFPEITMSRQDLASIVGTATESVIRIISEFKEDNAIEVKGSKIKVLNPSKLKNVMF